MTTYVTFWGGFPDILSRRVDGFDEGNNPDIEGASLDGNKGHGNAGDKKNKGEGIAKEKRNGRAVDEDRENNKNTKRSELANSHVTNEPETVVTDVLGYWVLLNGHVMSVLWHLILVYRVWMILWEFEI